MAKEQPNGYVRDKFSDWIDANGNGCDTRDEVLYRQDRAPRKQCGDENGLWTSVYDKERLTDSSELDIDHLVPLDEAWRSGANSWTAAQRERYANDLYGYDLIAVSASSNRSKGDSDPTDWLPPNHSYICRYLSHWVAVKYRWKLTLDSQEKHVLSHRFSNCSTSSIRVPPIRQAHIRQSKGAVPKHHHGKKHHEAGTDPRFDTCTDALAHGYGPYYRGQDREYGWYEDADSDGVVCES